MLFLRNLIRSSGPSTVSTVFYAEGLPEDTNAVTAQNWFLAPPPEPRPEPAPEPSAQELDLIRSLQQTAEEHAFFAVGQKRVTISKPGIFLSMISAYRSDFALNITAFFSGNRSQAQRPITRSSGIKNL